jgi:hypothetical protein
MKYRKFLKDVSDVIYAGVIPNESEYEKEE